MAEDIAFVIKQDSFYRRNRSEQMPESATLVEVFNGRTRMSLAQLRQKLGEERFEREKNARHFIFCARGQVKLSGKGLAN